MNTSAQVLDSPGQRPGQTPAPPLAQTAYQAAWWNPVGLVRARFQRWWHARLPFLDTMTLTQRSVYILPTRAGWMLALTLLVLLVASINYQLNLGYLLTFLLAGSAVVGMHVCHNTLRGLSLRLIAPQPQFRGASATFGVQLGNERKSPRHGIGLAVLGSEHWSWTDVPAQSSCVVQVAFRPEHRGLHRLPTLTAETRFPLGTFRVWTIWRPAAQVLVYPTPEPFAPPLPPGEPRSGGAAASRPVNSGEFDGVRGYRRGDPMKLIAWKKSTRALQIGSADLTVRDTQQAQRFELWLDFAQAGTGGTEQKLSRLTAWVLQADKMGLDYGLRLPGLSIKPAAGESHRLRCLEALALC